MNIKIKVIELTRKGQQERNLEGVAMAISPHGVLLVSNPNGLIRVDEWQAPLSIIVDKQE